jgi:hypothetical protein
VPSLHAAPNKVGSELQQRCAERSAGFFKHLGSNDASFENHYNPDLDGCFLLLTITKSQVGKEVTWVECQLWDVNEQRQIDVFAFNPGPQAFVIGTSENACLVGNFTNCRGGKRFGTTILHCMER